MQKLLDRLLTNQVAKTQTARFVASLDNNEINTLLADIEYAQSGLHKSCSLDTKDFLSQCSELIQSHAANSDFQQPKVESDKYGNTVIIFDYDGTEGEFWMSHIFGTDYEVIIQKSLDSMIYAHHVECKLIEFDQHVVYFRFGTRSALLNYLSDICSSPDGPYKCLFSPSYCLETIL